MDCPALFLNIKIEYGSLITITSSKIILISCNDGKCDEKTYFQHLILTNMKIRN